MKILLCFLYDFYAEFANVHLKDTSYLNFSSKSEIFECCKFEKAKMNKLQLQSKIICILFCTCEIWMLYFRFHPLPNKFIILHP
jgi:hypothetical protein